MWLRAQTANQKLEQNAQTQDADIMQDFSLLYMTQLETLSYQEWGVEGGPRTKLHAAL